MLGVHRYECHRGVFHLEYGRLGFGSPHRGVLAALFDHASLRVLRALKAATVHIGSHNRYDRLFNIIVFRHRLEPMSVSLK